jgi:hypothetical protein
MNMIQAVSGPWTRNAVRSGSPASASPTSLETPLGVTFHAALTVAKNNAGASSTGVGDTPWPVFAGPGPTGLGPTFVWPGGPSIEPLVLPGRTSIEPPVWSLGIPFNGPGQPPLGPEPRFVWPGVAGSVSPANSGGPQPEEPQDTPPSAADQAAAYAGQAALYAERAIGLSGATNAVAAAAKAEARPWQEDIAGVAQTAAVEAASAAEAAEAAAEVAENAALEAAVFPETADEQAAIAANAATVAAGNAQVAATDYADAKGALGVIKAESGGSGGPPPSATP